jgi:putative ATPase
VSETGLQKAVKAAVQKASIPEKVGCHTFRHCIATHLLKAGYAIRTVQRLRTLDEYIGQEHILGPGKLLRRAIEADRLFSSIILWGPPGTSKTTLAMVIANTTKSHFETLSAVLAGEAELREVIDAALERRKLYQKKTVLFVKDVLETLNRQVSVTATP